MKYKKYPNYKDSGVEWVSEIPSEWNKTKIKHLAIGKDTLFIDGDWIESKDISSSGIKYITTGNIGKGIYKEQGQGFITEDTFINLRCTEIYEGDLVLSRLNLPIGRACIIPDLKNRIVMAVDNVVIRPSKNYDKKFLLYLFTSKGYFQHTSLVARGTTMQRISRGLLGDIDIPFPTFSVQQQIAKFLDNATQKMDTLIQKQENLIKLLKEKRQAVISHAVTRGLNPDVKFKDSGVEWLGEVPEHWEVKKLGYITKKIGSGKTPRGGSEVYSDTGILFIRSQNVYDEGLFLDDVVRISKEINDDMANTQVKSGDILLNVTGGSIGRTTIVPDNFEKANVNQHVCIIRLNSKKSKTFISLVMKSLLIKTQIDAIQNGAAREGLNFEQISDFRLAIPPIEEQQKIVSYLDDKTQKIDTLIKKATKSIKLLKEKRTALISAAVTGKIDVREQV